MPLTAEHGLLAIAVAKSGNKKIGDCACTYAAQQSCPSSCAFANGGGCYAENGTLFSGIGELCDAAGVTHASAQEMLQKLQRAA